MGGRRIKGGVGFKIPAEAGKLLVGCHDVTDALGVLLGYQPWHKPARRNREIGEGLEQAIDAAQRTILPYRKAFAPLR